MFLRVTRVYKTGAVKTLSDPSRGGGGRHDTPFVQKWAIANNKEVLLGLIPVQKRYNTSVSCELELGEYLTRLPPLKGDKARGKVALTCGPQVCSEVRQAKREQPQLSLPLSPSLVHSPSLGPKVRDGMAFQTWGGGGGGLHYTTWCPSLSFLRTLDQHQISMCF